MGACESGVGTGAVDDLRGSEHRNTHLLRPRSSEFQALVASGSVCGAVPDRLGPTNTLRA